MKIGKGKEAKQASIPEGMAYARHFVDRWAGPCRLMASQRLIIPYNNNSQSEWNLFFSVSPSCQMQAP